MGHDPLGPSRPFTSSSGLPRIIEVVVDKKLVQRVYLGLSDGHKLGHLVVRGVIVLTKGHVLEEVLAEQLLLGPH